MLSFQQSVSNGFWFVKTIADVIDSFIGIFSGVTLLVYLCLAKCDIRFFGLQYATIGGSLKVFWKPGYFSITTL